MLAASAADAACLVAVLHLGHIQNVAPLGVDQAVTSALGAVPEQACPVDGDVTLSALAYREAKHLGMGLGSALSGAAHVAIRVPEPSEGKLWLQALVFRVIPKVQHSGLLALRRQEPAHLAQISPAEQQVVVYRAAAGVRRRAHILEAAAC